MIMIGKVISMGIGMSIAYGLKFVMDKCLNTNVSLKKRKRLFATIMAIYSVIAVLMVAGTIFTFTQGLRGITGCILYAIYTAIIIVFVVIFAIKYKKSLKLS